MKRNQEYQEFTYLNTGQAFHLSEPQFPSVNPAEYLFSSVFGV